MSQYTKEEHMEILKAMSMIDHGLPIKQFSDDEYTDDEVRELLGKLNDRIDSDPSVSNDIAWMDMWDKIQEIAGHRGISVS